MTHNQSLQVLLVENNPYDRAVLDACFEASPAARLLYTKMSVSNEAEAVSPRDLWELCSKREGAPDIVLLDLALTERCENALASEEYRKFLRTKGHVFREVDFVLSDLELPIRPLMIEGTLALLGGVQNVLSAEDLRKTIEIFDDDELYLTERSLEQKKKLGDGFFRVVDGSATSREVLLDWWKDEGTLATVREMARAPSILRIFACVAAFPNRCFGVVSHYANDDTVNALHAILSYRYRSPSNSAKQEVLKELVINKAHLFSAGDGVELRGLVDRLRAARELWEARESPKAAVAPFAAMPIVTPKGEQVEFWECIEKVWPRTYSPPLLSRRSGERCVESCIVLWDESVLLVGREGSWHATSTDRHLGWEAILRKDFPVSGCDVTTVDELRDSITVSKATCYVLHQKLKDNNDGENLARHIRMAFPGPPKFNILVVAGTSQARKAFESGVEKLEHPVALFRVPGWDDPLWEESLPERRQGFKRWLSRLIGKESSSARRQVIERFLIEFRLEPANQKLSEPLHRVLVEAVGEESAMCIIGLIANHIASSSEVSERWIEFEAHSTEILNRISRGDMPESVLEDFGFYERWMF